jgi:hypothetical protein
MAHVAYPEEIERLVGEYNQAGEHGEVYALDGKAPRGMRKKDDEEKVEYLLTVYDPEGRRASSNKGKSCRRWKWAERKMKSQRLQKPWKM